MAGVSFASLVVFVFLGVQGGGSAAWVAAGISAVTAVVITVCAFRYGTLPPET